MDIAVELLKSLGPAGATAAVLYLWVRAERDRADAEANERKAMTDRAIAAVEKSAQLQEATLGTLRGHSALLEDIADKLDGDTAPPSRRSYRGGR